MSYLMSKELGQAVLNYLGTQPYVQVASMIQGMTQMNEINDAEVAEYLHTKGAQNPPVHGEHDDGGVDEPDGD